MLYDAGVDQQDDHGQDDGGADPEHLAAVRLAEVEDRRGTVGDVAGGVYGDPTDGDQGEVVAYQPDIEAFGYFIAGV